MSEPRPRVSAATYTYLEAHAAKRGSTIGAACDDLVARARRRLESIASFDSKRTDRPRRMKQLSLGDQSHVDCRGEE